MMVVGDYLGGIHSVSSFLKHAPDVGFTIADTVAPAFVFIIGLNLGQSFERHLRIGRMAAYRHLLLRYLSLVGLGAIISAGSTVTGRPADWGVLQALGVAGLITLLVIELPTWARFLLGMLMLVGYQYLLDTSMLAGVLQSSHGGPVGAVSWAALLVLSTAVADVWLRGMRPYLICLTALVAVAGVAIALVPVSKSRVSLSYVLLTLAISALVFLLFQVVSRAIPRRAGIFCWWGQNALLLYLVHLVLLAIVVLPEVDWWYVEVPPWLATIQLVAILTFLTIAARWMSRRRRVSNPDPVSNSAGAVSHK